MSALTIVHISDLHFGDASAAALNAAHLAIASLEPACVVATGDITQAGRRSEFEAAAKWFAGIRAPVVACPGNHDIPVHHIFERIAKPYHRYDKLMLGERWASAAGEAAIGAINSSRALQARLDWSQGSYDIGHIEKTIARLEREAPSGWRFLAVHHPPFAPKGAKVDSHTRHSEKTMAKAGGVKKLITLAGHVHGFFVEKDPATGMRFVTAPSLASSRGRGQNSGFLQLEIHDHMLDITRWSYAPDAKGSQSGAFAPAGPATRLLA